MGKPRNPKYNQLLRDIRPHVTFDYDLRSKLSPAQKAKITRYHAEIAQATAQPGQQYRPQSRQNLQRIRKFAGITGFKERKTFFIGNPGERAKIRITKRGVSLAGKHVISRDIHIDGKKFVRDPEGELERALKGDKGKRYAIKLANEKRTLATFDRKALSSETLRYIAKYDPKWFRKVFVGVVSYRFKNQSDFTQHELEFFKKRMARRKQRRRRKK